MTLEVNFHCVFAQRSLRPCGGGGGPVGGNGVPRHARMQTLDELDAAALGGGIGASTVGVVETVGHNQVKVSWIILSRAGVNYLAHGAGGAGAGAGRWLICPVHRGEYLEEWNGSSAAAPCSYPTHDAAVPRTPARHPLTLAASARVLQGEGKVAPIGGRCCDACRARHDAAYPPKAKGEKVVLVVPRTPALAPPAPSLEVPSPFCTLEPPETASVSPTSVNPMSVVPSPFAAPVVHDATSPQITIKMEVVEEEPERMPTPLPYQEDITIKVEGENEQPQSDNDIVVDNEDEGADDGDQTEEEEEDIDGLFSDDSDDDRTWMPTSSTAKTTKKHTRSNKRSWVGSVESDKSSDDDDETSMPPPKAPKRKKNAKAKDKTSNENGNNKLYFCQICQITFYKHASYRQHMRSSKKAHQDIKSKEGLKLGPEVFECIDCRIAFKDRATQVRHMLTAHNSRQRAFHCEKCDVLLKNESAFKSHNSKLHLQRNERTFYCRVCDKIYSCRVEHKTHIKTHRQWSGEEPGFQCDTCGKLFTSIQVLLYQRHLATHDDNPDADCTCEKCSEAMESTEATPDTSEVTQTKRAKRPTTAGILQKMRMRVLNERDAAGDDDNDNDDIDSQFQCGLCSSSFDSPADLEKHVKVHYKSAAAEAEAKRAADTQDKSVPDNIIQEMSGSAKVRLTDNADRNWAAEFGYGKTLKAKPSGDLFLKMKSKFDLGEKDDEDDIVVVKPEKDMTCSDDEEEGDESFKVFRTRGFTGKVKASPKKVPRTLSDASLATRRRIETLIKRAREHQEKKNETKKKTSENEKKTDTTSEPNSNGHNSNNSSRRSKRLQDNGQDQQANNANEANEEDEEEEESVASFEGFEDEDEALLYPLANGWVMERTPVSARGRPPTNRPPTKSYLTSFWSPEGQQFENVENIRKYCKRERVYLDLGVFEKAMAKLTTKNK